MRDLSPGPAQDYLRRLNLLLERADPDLRRDVLAGIAEHLQAAGDAQAVREQIRQLGPPEDIASDALDDPTPGPSPAPLWTAATVGVWAGSACVALATALTGLLAAGLSLTAHFDDDADWSIPPLLAFIVVLAAFATALTGIILVIATKAGRSMRFTLLAVLSGVSALLVVSYPLAVAAPDGVGFLIASTSGVITVLLLVVVGRATMQAVGRG